MDPLFGTVLAHGIVLHDMKLIFREEKKLQTEVFKDILENNFKGYKTKDGKLEMNKIGKLSGEVRNGMIYAYLIGKIDPKSRQKETWI